MVVRIAGVNIPEGKQVWVSLTAVFGVGRNLALKALKEAGVAPEARVKDLREAEINKIREIIETKYRVEGDLRREIQGNVRRLIETGTYRGTRHKKNLPLRGQRTKTNARTKRGKKVTVGSGRKKAAEKT